MNPVEIYKKLPKTNCGSCRQKMCMPFAFALQKGEADLSDCPNLPPNERNELALGIKTFDWREELISKLQAEMSRVLLKNVAAQLGADFKNGRLHFSCFGKSVVVGSDGSVQSERPLTPWIRMLALFYIKNHGSADISGKWVLHNELRGGLMKYKAFQRECEEPLKALFDAHLDAAEDVLPLYGAIRQAGFATEHAWLIKVFPKMPVLFLYWPEDDEFGSKVTIRFDSSADEYFDVEQLIFLVEELIRDIEISVQ